MARSNFYGMQRTVFDDANDQNVQTQDAWGMAQHQNNWQNQRFRQGQSDARAMNQDNLTYYNARDAANAAAQVKLQELIGTQEAGRDTRGREHEANLWKDRGGQADLDFRNTERARTVTRRNEGDVYDNATQAEITAGTLDVSDPTALLKRLALRPHSGLEGMTPLLRESMQNRSDDEKISTDRILADINATDQARRTRGLAAAKAADPRVKRKLGAVPQSMDELAPIPLAQLKEVDQITTQQGIESTTEDANNRDGGIRDYGFEITAADPQEVASQVEDLRARVQGMRAATGGSAHEIWTKVKAGLDTGGWTWNPIRGFGAFDNNTQDINEAAIKLLDKEFGGFQ